MSDKIDISIVSEVIKQHKLDPAVSREIIEELMARIEASEADKPEPTPRGKQQYVGIVSGATGNPKDVLTGWIVQIPEEASPATALDRVMTAAHSFNASKKGRLLPVKTVGEAMESVKRKMFKEAGVAVKTKLPVYFLTTDNKLTEPPTT